MLLEHHHVRQWSGLIHVSWCDQRWRRTYDSWESVESTFCIRLHFLREIDLCSLTKGISNVIILFGYTSNSDYKCGG